MNNLLENKEFLEKVYKKFDMYPKKFVFNMLKKYIKSNNVDVIEEGGDSNFFKKLKDFIENKLKRSQKPKEDKERDAQMAYEEDRLQKMIDRAVRIKNIRQDREITNDKLRKFIEMEKKRGLDTKWIEELIKEDDISLRDFEVKKDMNDKFWEKNRLNPLVRKGLLKIAKKFIEVNNLQKIPLIDIVFTGSLANKNYSDKSDVDLHIVTDYNKISTDKDFVFDIFKTKKDEWASKYDITVFGYPVEIFVQDKEQQTPWANAYSLINDDWVNKVTLKNKINRDNIKKKSQNLISKIDVLLKNDENLSDNELLDRLELLVGAIREMRKHGLVSGGELDENNIVFKVLRNSGYLKKISDLKSKLIGKELTINEIFN